LTGSKKNKGSRAGDQLDSSDTDSISSSSTMSDFTPVYTTEHVTSNDFVLDKLIDALYEKRYLSTAFLLQLIAVITFLNIVLIFNSIAKGAQQERTL
jgi:hypothetical protein